MDTLNDNRNILICGDFNLHLENNDNYVSEFVELLDVHDLENTVKESTSLNNHIIDLVIQNKNNKIVNQVEVEPECAISPVHKLILFNINVWKNCTMIKTTTYRSKTNFNAEKFIDECSTEIHEYGEMNLQCNCELGNNCRNKKVCVNCFTKYSKNIMSSNYNNKCQEVTKQIKVKENAKWYNSELREARKNKRKMEDKWKRSKKEKKNENWSLYKAARNRYTDLIEKTKKLYYNKIFSETKNSKHTHNNLDELLGLKKGKILPEVTSNYIDLANNFVNYFEDKIERICLSLGNEVTSDMSTVVEINNNKFIKFKELNMNDFKEITLKLKNTYCENDPFPISDVKEAENFTQLQKIYFDVVNMSLTQAVFPKSEKLACIKPAYKGKGDKENLNSYRPVSNLSYLSKII